MATDFRQEGAGCGIGLLVSIALILALAWAFHDARYFFSGQTVDAKVSRVTELLKPEVRGPPSPALAIEYTYLDPKLGEFREKATVRLPWPKPERTVPVEYLPGVPGSARLVGTAAPLPMAILGLLSVGFAWTLFEVLREAKRHQGDRSGRHRRPAASR